MGKFNYQLFEFEDLEFLAFNKEKYSIMEALKISKTDIIYLWDKNPRLEIKTGFIRYQDHNNHWYCEDFDQKERKHNNEIEVWIVTKIK